MNWHDKQCISKAKLTYKASVCMVFKGYFDENRWQVLKCVFLSLFAPQKMSLNKSKNWTNESQRLKDSSLANTLHSAPGQLQLQVADVPGCWAISSGRVGSCGYAVPSRRVEIPLWDPMWWASRIITVVWILWAVSISMVVSSVKIISVVTLFSSV